MTKKEYKQLKEETDKLIIENNIYINEKIRLHFKIIEINKYINKNIRKLNKE